MGRYRRPKHSLGGDVMDGVREHSEGYVVEIGRTPVVKENANPVDYESRLVVRAYNEGGHNGTDVDLLDLIAWLRANRPELLDG